MTYRPVTSQQAEFFQSLANENRVGYDNFNRALEDGTLARFLALMNTGTTAEYNYMSEIRVAALAEAAEEVQGRIHVLRRICFQEDSDWRVAIDSVNPKTPGDAVIRQLENQNMPIGTRVVERDIVLFNYPGSDHWDKGLSWGKEMGLKNCNPRAVLAVGKQHPCLNEILGQLQLDVIAPVQCKFNGRCLAPAISWDGTYHCANAYWISHFDYRTTWFAFYE